MNTLEKHNEEVVKEFDEKFILQIEELKTKLVGNERKYKHFIQSQNKQLYIKIAEGEIERELNFIKTAELNPFDDNEARNSFIGAKLETVTHWQNILTELNK